MGPGREQRRSMGPGWGGSPEGFWWRPGREFGEARLKAFSGPAQRPRRGVGPSRWPCLGTVPSCHLSLSAGPRGPRSSLHFLSSSPLRSSPLGLGWAGLWAARPPVGARSSRARAGSPGPARPALAPRPCALGPVVRLSPSGPSRAARPGSPALGPCAPRSSGCSRVRPRVGVFGPSSRPCPSLPTRSMRERQRLGYRFGDCVAPVVTCRPVGRPSIIPRGSGDARGSRRLACG